MESTEYYHISDIENVDSILKNGLRANKQMHIFVCTSLSLLPIIASGQLGIIEYSIFKLNPQGIEVTPIHDNVAELGNEYQFIIKQPVINPIYIVHLEDWRWHRYEMAEYAERYRNRISGLEKMGESKILEDKVRFHPEWCEYYNKKYGKKIRPQA
jgi:hypothetical protein